ncbi:RagB/SusD family nutrient uptake outer membrane protein [Zunongwangia pacifica]|uniref:RagB/SusD family nutrient uptake outer membrane protein n=1 Tax=Zunongwangia pacifica TaxID=2911062 RepID=A0A9X1ZV28_9FLAO|nr:RagB/SusD family nutrient uptake outer membrane protein [Zunongwangia pacifica]MCL6218983.1 RagB/SusD family nutrient uptake outer membrane protein [Zunongwangia pacifica]
MKNMKSKYLIPVLLLFIITGCSDALEEETFSSLGPSNFYTSAEDAESLLNGVYANSQGYRDLLRDYLALGEMTTDVLIERGGAINATTQPIEDFEFDASHPYFQFLWTRNYSAIYRANVVIDQVPAIEMNEDRKAEIIGEARFLRALNYYQLYYRFGPTPLIINSETSVTDRPERAGEEEFLNFLINEFQTAANSLPTTQMQYGRATSGAALGFLAKVYLNDKQWQQAAETAQLVINSGVYDLYIEGSREQLFALENEGDNEFIFVIPYADNPNRDSGNTYLSHAAPPGYQFQFPPKVNFAAQFKTRSEFIDMFSDEDQRLNSFVFEYQNLAGETVTLGQDDVRSFKYPEDPNGVGDVSGNDFPLLRYADILLTRAEALNEIQGPNQETIDLINMVRIAAGVPQISLSDFSGTTSLRDFIFTERGREFFTEALRRQDLIRQGTFISKALARGKAAQDFQVLFPIPQSEIDKNSNLEQNPGY